MNFFREPDFISIINVRWKTPPKINYKFGEKKMISENQDVQPEIN